jgi:hypothetical protein
MTTGRPRSADHIRRFKLGTRERDEVDCFKTLLLGQFDVASRLWPFNLDIQV